MCTGSVVATCINSNDHDSNFCSCETTLFIIAPLIDGRIDAEATNQSSCIRTYSRTTPELWTIESFYSPYCSGSSEVHVIWSIYSYIVGGTRPEVYPEVVLNGAANCRQQLRRRHAHDCCFAAASSRERRCCNTMAFEPVGGCGGY